MKKNEIIAMQNRLEYLKDTVKKLRKEILEYETGMAELQIGQGIILKQMALEYGGEDHTITLRHRDDIHDWEAEVTRDAENRSLTIRLYREEKYEE